MHGSWLFTAAAVAAAVGSGKRWGLVEPGIHLWTAIEIWGFPKIRGTLLGVPIIRTIVFWGLYWGPPYFGKLPYHFGGYSTESFAKLGQFDLNTATINTHFLWSCGRRT